MLYTMPVHMNWHTYTRNVSHQPLPYYNMQEYKKVNVIL